MTIKDNINSLPEETASKSLEKASKQYAVNYTSNDNGNGGDDWEDDIAIAFKAGAKHVLNEFEPLIATLRTGARVLFEAKVKELKGE